MWMPNCDIFLLVFSLVTVTCSIIRDGNSNGIDDFAPLHGSSYPNRAKGLDTEFETKNLDDPIYDNRIRIIVNTNKFASESDADESFGELVPSEIGTNTLVSYFSSHLKPHRSKSKYVVKSVTPIANVNHLTTSVDDSHSKYESKCGNRTGCRERSRRSISNSPFSTLKDVEYHSELLQEDKNNLRQKNGRQLNVDSSIDDIINGIMKLLGGNVKTKAAETSSALRTSTETVLKTRINNRGPPRLPALNFGIPAIPDFTKPIFIHPSATSKHAGHIPITTSTKPPYAVPFPPKLFEPPPNKPFLNGVPLPINILPGNEDDLTTINSSPDSATTDNVIGSSKTTTDSYPESIEQFITTKAIEPTRLESSLNDEDASELSDADTSTASVDGIITSPTTKPPPNLTVKFSLASVDKSHSRKASQGMVSIQTSVTTPSSKSSTAVPSHPVITAIHTTGVARPTTIPPEDMFVYPSIPTRLPDPIRTYGPVGGHRGTVLSDSTFPLNQVITAAAATNSNIFDVTVSAIQGYNSPARPPPQRRVRPGEPLITSATKKNDGVFIDGRKTYFDLQPGRRPSETIGYGTVIPEKIENVPYLHGNRPDKVSPSAIRPTVTNTPSKPKPKPKPKPSHRPTLGPPKRIDTCIVGYDNTCKKELGEVCRTEGDVSSCFCRPGTGRKRGRTKCKKSVILQLSLKVDRVGDRRISWNGNYANPESREYQILSYEAGKALGSAFTLTPGMAGLYFGSTINKFYSLGGNVIVNSTIQLLRTPQTSSTSIRRSLQRHLIRVIQTNNNYIGKSVLAVEGYLNPIPDVSDVNECFDANLNDCHSHASCTNVFGSFMCTCFKGYTDRNANDVDESGRVCLSCSRDFCSKRGNCTIKNEKKMCSCDSAFYGSRCDIDVEVIYVAVGASVVAIVIILLTLLLLRWKSRQWKAKDRRAQIFSAAGGFFGWRGRGQAESAYSMNMRAKGGNPAYGAMMEDRIRWSQMAETMAQQNIYAQPEQMRPAVYQEQRKMPPPPSEYGSVGTLAHQQFGMHCMNPPPFLPTVATGGPNSLSQFTSTSINAASLGGISRAPTLGARTPEPLKISRGFRSYGPLGGGIAIKYHRDGISPDSSEEDDSRPYHLPRPKSRGSLAVGVESSRLARSYNSLLF